MNLYLISQQENDDYDTYDSAVVAAESAEDAKKIHPSGSTEWYEDNWCKSPDSVKVDLIGKAIDGTKVGVILNSFTAG